MKCIFMDASESIVGMFRHEPHLTSNDMLYIYSCFWYKSSPRILRALQRLVDEP